MGVGMGGDLRYGLLVWAYRCCGDTLDARARHGCFRILNDGVAWRTYFSDGEHIGGRYWNAPFDEDYAFHVCRSKDINHLKARTILSHRSIPSVAPIVIPRLLLRLRINNRRRHHNRLHSRTRNLLHPSPGAQASSRRRPSYRSPTISRHGTLRQPLSKRPFRLRLRLRIKPTLKVRLATVVEAHQRRRCRSRFLFRWRVDEGLVLHLAPCFVDFVVLVHYRVEELVCSRSQHRRRRNGTHGLAMQVRSGSGRAGRLEGGGKLRGGTAVCGLRAWGWSGFGLHFAAGGAELVGEGGDGPAGPRGVVLRG